MIGIVKIKFAQVRRFVLDGHCAISFLLLERWCHDRFEISVERRRQRGDFQVGEITLQQFFFAGIEAFVVLIGTLLRFVVQRKDQRIIKRHPTKTRRRQTASHGDAVRKHRFNVELIQNPGGRALAALFDDGLLSIHQLPHVRFAHVVVRITIQIVPRANELRISRAQAHRQRKRRDRVEWQCVEFIVRFLAFRDVFQRMRVIVDRFDLHDLGKQI